MVGAGVIGMTSAFGLARAGWRVTLFDPTPGMGATWAAAGMLAPFAEASPGERSNFDLQRGALAAWRKTRDELFGVTGDALEIVETGTLLVGYDAGDRRLADQFDEVSRTYGGEPERVDRSTHAKLFEGVSARISGGLFLSGDAWLDPDRVVQLLTRANAALGVVTVRQEVLSASTVGTEVEAKTGDAVFRGDIGILATGASQLPLGVADTASNVVRPVRGMTVRVRLPDLDRSTLPSVRAYVRGRSFYCVSRPGGYCVIGASSDEQRELIVEVGELQRLLRDGLDVIPSLETASFLEIRQGLRPASRDLAPFFEVLFDRWGWLSGYYRHGVTLAPLAANEALAFARTLA